MPKKPSANIARSSAVRAVIYAALVKQIIDMYAISDITDNFIKCFNIFFVMINVFINFTPCDNKNILKITVCRNFEYIIYPLQCFVKYFFKKITL